MNATRLSTSSVQTAGEVHEPALTGSLAEKISRAKFLTSDFLHIEKKARKITVALKTSSPSQRNQLIPLLLGYTAYMRTIVRDFKKEYSVCDDAEAFYSDFILHDGDLGLKCSIHQVTREGTLLLSIEGYGSLKGNLRA